MILPKRIADKFQETDSCWVWKSALSEKGYGRVFVKGKNRYAHRVIWELAKGEIPEGMDVLHKCDNPPCVNPDHLFLGTQGDNMLDMYKKGRHVVLAGTKNFKAKLSESDVYHIRASKVSAHKIAPLFEITPSTVFRVRSGQYWKHLPQTTN